MNALLRLSPLLTLILAAPPVAAADICQAIALRDLRAVDVPGAVLKKGKRDEAVTQYRVNKKTGEARFCSHGGACFPVTVTENGRKVEALRLTNCKVGAKDPFDDPDETFYNLDVIRSKVPAGALRIDDVDNKLLDMGLCNACASNVAYLYVKQPGSRCAKLTARAFAGDPDAVKTLKDFPDYCTAPGAEIAALHCRHGPRSALALIATPVYGARPARMIARRASCPAPSNAVAVAEPIVRVANLAKVYAGGFKALDAINLEIRRGEIFALLGPNGAGKTTLISIICGIVNPSEGSVIADGHDIRRDYRAARAKIGLVPQELSTDMFETVWNTVRFSRGLFGKPPDPAHLEHVLRDVALWDRRYARIKTVSGGMKRRVMIAKALSHEPTILFLDEPTAGVDVELRRDMWRMVRSLRDSGVTIILTTHYIEEAEDLADRIGVINNGKLVVVEEKTELMHKLGKKKLAVSLLQPLERVPEALTAFALELSPDGRTLTYTYETDQESGGVRAALQAIETAGLAYRDIDTKSSSLEEIFVDIIRDQA